VIILIAWTEPLTTAIGEAAEMRLLAGLVATLLVTLIARLLFQGPIQRWVKRSKIEWDDQLLELLGPLVRWGVILAGLYVTLEWMVTGEGSLITDGSKSHRWLALILSFGPLALMTRFLLQFVDIFLNDIIRGQDRKRVAHLNDSLRWFGRIVKTFIWLGAAFIFFNLLGFNVTPALASMGILSILIGLALQDSASNLVAGLLLLADRPFQEGDKVQIGDYIGIVQEIGLQSTKIRTFKEQMIVFPNRSLAEQEVINFARGGPTQQTRRINVKMTFGVAYEEQPEHVKQVITETAAKCPFTLEEPKPTAHLVNFNDSSIDFLLNAWVDDFNNEFIAKDWINTHLFHRFNEEDISIPFPHTRIIYTPPTSSELDDMDQDYRARKAAEREKQKRQQEAVMEARREESKALVESQVRKARIDELVELLDNDKLSDEERAKLQNEFEELTISTTDE